MRCSLILNHEEWAAANVARVRLQRIREMEEITDVRNIQGGITVRRRV